MRANNQFAIELVDITKTFLNGKIVANKDVNVQIRHGEVHALIGENGAGKSTLMSILFGLYAPDSGEIKINGEAVYFYNATDATRSGLGMVHQHFKLIDDYTILQNILLGNETTNKVGLLKLDEARSKINHLIKKYRLGLNIDDKVANININQRQKVEILKLLYKDAKYLIFDEPTSILNDYEIELFLEMIRNFKKEGKTIIIISHKLNELKEVADRGTILRHGKTIETFDIKSKTISQIADIMVGKTIATAKNAYAGVFQENEVVLDVDNINIKKGKKNISFKVHRGEIYAIAGVEGNGQKELALMLSGIMKTKTGSIMINGVDITKYNVKKRYDIGLSHIPEDNRGHGLILDLSIADNIVSQILGRSQFSSFGFINQHAVKRYSKEIIKSFDVRGASDINAPVRGLSGGNQQKLIVGREFTREHELVIMVQPTKGLDVGAIQYIHNVTLQQKQLGKAVLLISYELDEIMSLCDTIAVVSNHSIVFESKITNTSRSEIGTKIAGN